MTSDPDYMGGLEMPDLRVHFKYLHWRVMGHSFGRLVASDWADKPDDEQWHIWKQCGLWCREEAAILYHCAKRAKGTWLDIGANVGWTTAHMATPDNRLVAVDPILKRQEFQTRFEENMAHCWSVLDHASHLTSHDWFYGRALKYAGVCIDGDHMSPHPQMDACNASAHLSKTGVILLHDVLGDPVQKAVLWLQDNGFRTRIYLTPHVVACCWRGDFTPPDHVPEPALVEQNLPARMPIIDWSRCE